LLLWSQGHHEQAEPLAHASLAIADQLADTELTAHAVHLLGLVAHVQHQWERAELLLDRALGLWRELGAEGLTGVTLMLLSGVSVALGDAEVASRRAEESLAIYRALDDAAGAANTLCQLARLARARGDDRRAASIFHEALLLWAGVGDRWTIVRALAGLAAIAAAHDQPEQAATLVGAIDARADEVGLSLSSSVFMFAGAAHDQAATAARGTLGEERFASLRTAGRALPLATAIALAAAVVVPDDSVDANVTRQPAAGLDALSAREHDVLRLIAEGRTDRAIAETLFVSRRTVNTHVANILAKLGVATRRDAAARASEQGWLPTADLPSRYT
jgi:ATP/maltotriose-dependent transcriptional regulator MalT